MPRLPPYTQQHNTANRETPTASSRCLKPQPDPYPNPIVDANTVTLARRLRPSPCIPLSVCGKDRLQLAAAMPRELSLCLRLMVVRLCKLEGRKLLR